MAQLIHKKFMEKFNKTKTEVNLLYIMDRDLTLKEKTRYDKMNGMKFHNITNDIEWRKFYKEKEK